MQANEKFDVFPTPMSKQNMQHLLKNAEKGHRVLKKKSDVLQMKFRTVGHEIIEIKCILGKIMKDASYLLAETKYHTGDIKNHILNQVCRARLKVRSRIENVAGVQLRLYECFEAAGDQYLLTGLAKGGEKLSQLKRAFGDATELLVHLATLQTSFLTLDEIIQTVNRRVNALEHRYIPKVQNTLKYIESELDENERQDFYRMKMIKNKKKEQVKKKEKEQDLRKEKSEGNGRRQSEKTNAEEVILF